MARRARTRVSPVARGLATAFALASAAIACGGSGSSGPMFNCKSNCPNDGTVFSSSPWCQGTLTSGQCLDRIAAFLQCEHDHQVCDSSGRTDQARTDAACMSQNNAINDCFSCLSGSCPDASGTVDAGGNG